MMRALAEFTMRGRLQAIAMVLVGNLIPLLAVFTPASVSLITLRRGWLEGLLIALSAALILVAIFAMEGVGPYALYISVGAVFTALATASVLRATISWQATLAVLVACSALVSILASLAVTSPAEGLLSSYQTLLDAQPEETRAELESTVRGFAPQLLQGALAFSVSLYALLGLLLGRLWQALLFNVGGLRKEMHELRMSLSLAAACVFGFVYCEWRGDAYAFWQLLFALPLLIAGLGLVHCIVAQRKLGRVPLVAMYIGMIVVPPVAFVVAMLGLTDVWLDFRKRFKLQP